MSVGKVKTLYRKGYRVLYWYDYSVRAWYAIRVDKENNQVGEAIDAARVDSIFTLVNRGDLDDENS